MAAEPRQSSLWLNATAAEFSGWQLNGAVLRGEGFSLDPATALSGRDSFPPGSYNGKNYYNGGTYSYGTALSPVISPLGGFESAIVSWNAATPVGTWVEVRLKALLATENRWTKEYSLGIWAEGKGTVNRHSVANQADGDGDVSTDTLNLRKKALAFQVKVILFTENRSVQPAVSLLAVNTVREGATSVITSPRTAWGIELKVPELSQMIYTNGGDEWCSPTSMTMALDYWAGVTNQPNLKRTVPSAADATYDFIYDGNGNWVFNTAYAYSVGKGSLRAYATRFNSLSQVEAWIEKGVPVIISLAFQPGQLTGAPIASSAGHLILVRGFDREGNVITNDPAGDPRKAQPIRTVYNREQFANRWLQASGGLVYLVYPETWKTPTNLRGESWALPDAERLKNFADPAIKAIWDKSDYAVASGNARRSWLWGNIPLTPARLETYDQAPGGTRIVQYFDKSRMEITRPQADRASKWFVTNGLLTVELVTGRRQLGDNRFMQYTPAMIPVAGDADSPLAPTYSVFRDISSVEGKLAERRAPNRTGQVASVTLDLLGRTGQKPDSAVRYASYESTLGHNVPDVFWSWMNNPAASGLADGWLFALGYPISEAYWVNVNIAGKPTIVLVQLFERRALTYTPGNPPGFQVEMGNIGQHYLRWRG